MSRPTSKRVNGNWYDINSAAERIAELENLLAEGVHSCSHLCKRPMCVLRRENQELEAKVAALKADIHAFLGHPCGKTVQDLRKAILDGEDD